MLVSDTFWMGLALALVIEGAFPFIAPARWRSGFAKVLQQSDVQIRCGAAIIISAGLLLICFLN